MNLKDLQAKKKDMTLKSSELKHVWTIEISKFDINNVWKTVVFTCRFWIRIHMSTLYKYI